jgi:glycosyltransferase involved in cell wall biosynthesis
MKEGIMDGINFNLHTNDLFENGDIGLRVKPADPDALADAILKLFNDFELCKKFSENGLKKEKSLAMRRQYQSIWNYTGTIFDHQEVGMDKKNKFA